MNILVTGSEGFIAKNIIVFLQQLENVIIYKLNKSTTKKKLKNMLVCQK